MKYFGIIRNTDKTRAAACADQIRSYLTANDCSCHISTDGSDLPDETQCAIVLGGDGTLLRAAKVVLERQIPLIGINLGTLGYMAEVEVKNMYPAIDRLMNNDFTIERRMMIHGSVYRNQKEIISDAALNDIVIGGLKQIRAYEFKSFVNNTYLATYHADGMIVATPTGSTGYSLSAGGPIVSPASEILLMTPVASHSLIARSIIFSGTDQITIEIGEGRMGTLEDVAEVNFDGGSSVKLSTGDLVKVTRSDKYTQFIKLNDISFLEVLRQKMSNQ